MNRGPAAPLPQPQILKKRDSLGRRLVSLPERFWDWVVDTVDVNHDELLSFFSARLFELARVSLFRRAKNSFVASVFLNAMAAIMMVDYDPQRRLVLLGILFSISSINTYLFFSRTKSYQLFQPNPTQLESRNNVDVIKITTPMSPMRVGGHSEVIEKDVWVLHTWQRAKFSSVLFKWASPVSILIWYAGRDQIRSLQFFLFFCVLFCGWQLSKLVDAYESALEDTKLIFAELNVESEMAAKRHFSLTKHDAGSQTESLYSRGLPSSTRMPLAHARATPPPATAPSMYRSPPASSMMNDSPPRESFVSSGWGASAKSIARPMPVTPGARTSPVSTDRFSNYTSPALHAASSQYSPPMESFRMSPPPATQVQSDSMDVDTDYRFINGSPGYGSQPQQQERFIDVGLPQPGHYMGHSSPPRATNRFSAASPISPPSNSINGPMLSPPPPGSSIQFELPPTTSLNGF